MDNCIDVSLLMYVCIALTLFVRCEEGNSVPVLVILQRFCSGTGGRRELKVICLIWVHLESGL